MKRLLLVALACAIVGCSPPAAPERPQPTNPAPSAPPYTSPASLSDVALQAGTVAEVAVSLATPPVTFGVPDNCAVVIKTTPTQQIASLGAGCSKDALVFLAFRHSAAEPPFLYFGLRPGDHSLHPLDVLIERIDGGLIVREIGAELPSRNTNGLNAWST